jgi:hypothetical protein
LYPYSKTIYLYIAIDQQDAGLDEAEEALNNKAPQKEEKTVPQQKWTDAVQPPATNTKDDRGGVLSLIYESSNLADLYHY